VGQVEVSEGLRTVAHVADERGETAVHRHLARSCAAERLVHTQESEIGKAEADEREEPSALG
jgi:hypothetical protein